MYDTYIVCQAANIGIMYTKHGMKIHSIIIFNWREVCKFFPDYWVDVYQVIIIAGDVAISKDSKYAITKVDCLLNQDTITGANYWLYAQNKTQLLWRKAEQEDITI